MRIALTILALVFYSAGFSQDSLSKTDGLKINTNAQGPATLIRFRCSSTTVDSTKQPLLVVDGVPREYSYLKTLDPNQIESISILKESKSTQLLCTGRALNGIIVITMKCKEQKSPSL